MAQDLLPIKDNIYTYEITNVKGFTSEKSAKLGDGDELWEEFKYTHIQDAYSALQKKFSNFVKQHGSMSRESLKKMDMKKMGEVISNMPAYTELLNMYSLHMNISGKCLDVFNEKKLKLTGEFE